jgi:hypothetical protein
MSETDVVVKFRAEGVEETIEACQRMRREIYPISPSRMFLWAMLMMAVGSWTSAVFLAGMKHGWTEWQCLGIMLVNALPCSAIATRAITGIPLRRWR